LIKWGKYRNLQRSTENVINRKFNVVFVIEYPLYHQNSVSRYSHNYLRSDMYQHNFVIFMTT